MAAFDEEYAKWTANNLRGNGGVSERVLWFGTAVAIGFLVALFIGIIWFT